VTPSPAFYSGSGGQVEAQVGIGQEEHSDRCRWMGHGSPAGKVETGAQGTVFGVYSVVPSLDASPWPALTRPSVGLRAGSPCGRQVVPCQEEVHLEEEGDYHHA
jgi:hypothetical protein